MHCPGIGSSDSQIDRGRRMTVNATFRYLPQLRALDPMPVLAGAGGVSSILNGIVKLA